MSRFLIGLALAGATLVCLPGCNSHSPGDPICEIPCQVDDECLVEQVCDDGCCRQPPDATVQPPDHQPRILVAPEDLSWICGFFGVPTTLPLTVTNGGDADLVVSAIEIEEPDALAEFTSEPQGPVDLVLPPGASLDIQVSYTVLDVELDVGLLRIHSNDPQSPVVTVPLVDDCKCCEPVLDVCALDGTQPAPAPFVDCVLDGSGDPLVDFGAVNVPYVTRTVAIRNAADGNVPLHVESIELTHTTGLGLCYELAIYWVDEDPQTGDPVLEPATLPLLLEAGDTMAGVAPDQLQVVIRFLTSFIGDFPNEHLVIRSNDPVPELYIPVVGLDPYCHFPCRDLLGDPSTPCDCSCIFQSLEDSCASPGIDLNCDGIVETEDVHACVTLYRDLDGDSYGTADATRCLCDPDPSSAHTATLAGDCNDASPLAHPTAVELCDATDNDCNGLVDDGCVP